MGYQIVYRTGQRKKGRTRLPFLTLLCFVLFLLLVECQWAEGAEFLHNIITGNLLDNAVSSFNQLADALRFGEELETAFSEFIENLSP